MADMREALLKAGLVSKKEAKQAKHRERVHRKEVGRDGVEQERKERDQTFRAEQEAKRRHDQKLEEAQRAEQEEAAGNPSAGAALDGDLTGLIRAGVQAHAHGGNRRFYFIVDTTRITFLDLTDSGVRALLDRRAAIVDSNGARSERYCVVDTETADAIRKRQPELLKYWGE